VLEDLGALRYLDPVLLSEEVGIEKPAGGIWTRALKVAGMMSSHEALHVGDDLKEWVHPLISTSDGVDIDFRTLVTTLGRSKLD
jgi:FMN phosphatase YigB (HAD superfamily)